LPTCWSTPSSTTRCSPTSPLGDSLDVFVRREDAERFIEAVRGDDPDLASCLRIEERERSGRAELRGRLTPYRGRYVCRARRKSRARTNSRRVEG
jgi:hypothetical protein